MCHLCDPEDAEDEDEQLAEADRPDILAIHRANAVAVLTNNQVVPITHWFNRKGEDCAPGDAVVLVCGSDAAGWYTVDVEAYEYVTLH